MSCFRGRVEREQRRRSKAIDEQLKRDRAVYRKTLKLLVLGEKALREAGLQAGLFLICMGSFV